MLLKLKFSVHKVAKSWFEWTRSNCRSHPHSYTHIHISIQNFGEYSDPLPNQSPPPKKNKYKYKKGIGACFSIILLHTLSKEPFGIASSECPPKQSFFQQLMSQTCLEPSSKVTRIFNCVAALGKTGKDSYLKMIHDLFPFREICDIWELFFFLGQSLIIVRVKKIKNLKYRHFNDINMSSCVTLLGFPQEHCPWVSSGVFRLRL